MAEQPEVVSVDELKSLLTLTRERFLDHFDAIIPKTILRKTDKIITSNLLNGKYFVTLNISSFLYGICDSYSLLLKLIKYIDQIKMHLINLNNDIYICIYKYIRSSSNIISFNIISLER